MPGNTFDELLDRAKAGCPDSLGRLLEMFRNYLLVIANADLDPDLAAKGGASDMVQETFLEAHRDFARFRGGNRGDLLAWLRGILSNNMADFRRAFRQAGRRDVARERRVTDSNDLGRFPGRTETPSVQAVGREQADRLERALARLSEEHRTVIELRNRDHMRFAQIGERLGRSADAVRMLWARAVERLQAELDGLGE